MLIGEKTTEIETELREAQDNRMPQNRIVAIQERLDEARSRRAAVGGEHERSCVR